MSTSYFTLLHLLTEELLVASRILVTLHEIYLISDKAMQDPFLLSCIAANTPAMALQSYAAQDVLEGDMLALRALV